MNKIIEDFLKNCIFAREVFREDHDGNLEGFRHDKSIHDTARSLAFNILKRLGEITPEEFTQASRDAWSGRVSLENGKINYIAGQFYNLEVPQAIAAVLEKIEKNRECDKCGEIHDVELAGGHDLIQADKILRCECNEHPDDEFCQGILAQAEKEEKIK